MQVIGQSIVKADNDIYEGGIHRLNEDAYIIKENIVAISDGAGGIGILADQWSSTLVNNIPNKVFKSTSSLDKWIGDLWEQFYNTNLLKLRTDPWKLKKFESEGSLATLSVLWQLSINKFKYQSYGDSALFIFNNKTGKLSIQDNMKSINCFTTNPALINWKIEKHDQTSLYIQEIELNENESIIMATDGIAMYIHGAYIVYCEEDYDKIEESKMIKIIDYFNQNPIEDFKEWMNKLLSSLSSENNFKKLMKEWHDTKFLPNDDYTLVWVKNK